LGVFINLKGPIIFTNRQEPGQPITTTAIKPVETITAGLLATEDSTHASRGRRSRGQDVMNRLEFRKSE
jgi:hypothetical protein